ncbi:MAG: type II toxin-antitoxin system RelE/ParE family toxin [Nitrospirae bacterium]|nr:type II toxin-antitoxin system RelE/ParE family toxin [Nitrospirota bacterium]
MPYEVRFSKVAFRDVKSLSPKLQKKLREIIAGQLTHNPYAGKRLVGDLTGFYSLRLSLKDRIVYSIDEEHQIIYIHRAKTHYGE